MHAATLGYAAHERPALDQLRERTGWSDTYFFRGRAWTVSEVNALLDWISGRRRIAARQAAVPEPCSGSLCAFYHEEIGSAAVSDFGSGPIICSSAGRLDFRRAFARSTLAQIDPRSRLAAPFAGQTYFDCGGPFGVSEIKRISKGARVAVLIVVRPIASIERILADDGAQSLLRLQSDNCFAIITG